MEALLLMLPVLSPVHSTCQLSPEPGLSKSCQPSLRTCYCYIEQESSAESENRRRVGLDGPRQGQPRPDYPIQIPLAKLQPDLTQHQPSHPTPRPPEQGDRSGQCPAAAQVVKIHSRDPRKSPYPHYRGRQPPSPSPYQSDHGGGRILPLSCTRMDPE